MSKSPKLLALGAARGFGVGSWGADGTFGPSAEVELRRVIECLTFVVNILFNVVVGDSIELDVLLSMLCAMKSRIVSASDIEQYHMMRDMNVTDLFRRPRNV